MKKIIDMLGKRYGRLTVIEYAGLNRQGALWKCKCDCGNEKIIEGRSLRCGNTSSCGCIRTEMYENRIKDMVGLKFGRLTVIESAGSSKRGILWRCRCDCGNYRIVSGSNLRYGTSKSCGCILDDKKDRFFVDCIENTKLGALCQKERSDNTTGKTGVYFDHNKKKYYARITFQKKIYHLGYFNTFEEAKDAREGAEQKYHKDFLEKHSYKKEKNTKG